MKLASKGIEVENDYCDNYESDDDEEDCLLDWGDVDEEELPESLVIPLSREECGNLTDAYKVSSKSSYMTKRIFLAYIR